MRCSDRCCSTRISMEGFFRYQKVEIVRILQKQLLLPIPPLVRLKIQLPRIQQRLRMKQLQIKIPLLPTQLIPQALQIRPQIHHHKLIVQVVRIQLIKIMVIVTPQTESQSIQLNV